MHLSTPNASPLYKSILKRSHIKKSELFGPDYVYTPLGKKNTGIGLVGEKVKVKVDCGPGCSATAFLNKKITPQEKTEAIQEKTETIYSNPLQITTEYAPFSPSLSEVAPVIIPENPQDEQKSKLSTSGIIGVGLALAAGLL